MTEIENGFAEIACPATFVGHAEVFAVACRNKLTKYVRKVLYCFGKPDDELPPKVLI